MYISSLMSFIINIEVTEHQEILLWCTFALSLPVTMSLWLLAFISTVTLTPSFMVGLFLFGIASSLLSASACIAAGTNTFVSYEVGIPLLLGNILFFLGTIIVFMKGRHIFSRPVVYPQNLILYATFFFHLASITGILSALHTCGWVDFSNDTFRSIRLLSWFMLCLGALSFVLFSIKDVCHLDYVSPPQYKSMWQYANSFLASVLLIPPILLFCMLGAVIAFFGSFFGSYRGSSEVTRFLGYIIFSFSFFLSGTLFHKVQSISIPFFTGTVCFLYAITILFNYTIDEDWSDHAEKVFSSMASLFFAVSSFCYFRWFRMNMLLPGSYLCLSHILFTLGFLFFFIGTVDEEENYINHIRMGDSLIIMGSLLYSIHLLYCLEVSMAANYTNKSLKITKAKFMYSSKEQQNGKRMLGNVNVKCDVLICGAGPCGLALALYLGQEGFKVIIIETRQEPIADARFFAVNSTGMEFYKHIGIEKDITANGIPEDMNFSTNLVSKMTCKDDFYVRIKGLSREEAKKYYLRNMKKYSECASSYYAFSMPHRIMQSQHESTLLRLNEENPNVDVRYGWTLTNFEDTGNSVISEIGNEKSSMNDGEHTELISVESRFLCGCDGANSKVASILNVTYDGFLNLSVARNALICSHALTSWIVKETGGALQMHVIRRNIGIALFVTTDIERGLIRFTEAVGWDGKPPPQRTDEEIIEYVCKYTGQDIPVKVLYNGKWYWNFFGARRFFKGNVALLGDAIHSHPPFGGLGGNTGLGDVRNFGWKLTMLLKDYGGPLLLESYDLERHQLMYQLLLYVLRLAPRPGHASKLGHAIQKPLLRNLVMMRYVHGNSGFHEDNHYSTEGMQLGVQIKFSPLIYKLPSTSAHYDDSPNCLYTPRIKAGERFPNLIFSDGTMLHECVHTSMYTLFYKSEENCDIVSKSFKSHSAPLHLINITDIADSFKANYCPDVLASFKSQILVLVRPDCVTAFCTKNESDISVETIQAASSASLGWQSLSRKTIFQADCYLNFLNSLFVKQIQPFRSLFPNAIYLSNTTKRDAVKIVRKKTADFTILTKINNEKKRGSRRTKMSFKAISNFFRRPTFLSQPAAEVLRSASTISEYSSESSDDESLGNTKMVTVEEIVVRDDIFDTRDFYNARPRQSELPSQGSLHRSLSEHRVQLEKKESKLNL